MKDLFSWIALSSAKGVGPALFRRILERFETPEAALSAAPEQLACVRGITEDLIKAIFAPECRRFAEAECHRLEESGATVVTFLDPEYPRRLFETGSPPPLLYLKGNLRDWEPAVAIVGSRRATREGLKAAERLASELAGAGVIVVSGMARGIDTAAHRGAISGGVRTIAVLGSGVDLLYPPENKELAAGIAENGCIMSEFPLGTQPLAENFPRRNRIISGLSRGVVVVEAAEKSGSLITARYALEQGREVMAVPGPIFNLSSRGSNRLIKEGAALVDCLEDILSATGLDRGQQQLSFDSQPARQYQPASLTPKEAALFELVSKGPLHPDEICEAMELTSAEVSAMVLGLELKGILVRLPGSFYSLP